MQQKEPCADPWKLLKIRLQQKSRSPEFSGTPPAVIPPQSTWRKLPQLLLQSRGTATVYPYNEAPSGAPQTPPAPDIGDERPVSGAGCAEVKPAERKRASFARALLEQPEDDTEPLLTGCLSSDMNGPLKVGNLSVSFP